MLIAMLIPTHDLLLRLYIGELRGRNISTPPSPDLRSALWQSYTL